MWRFTELPSDVPERDPHEAEFFHLKEPAEAVVREFVQNALDAQEDGKVVVKFTFGEIEKGEVEKFFTNYEDHFIATKITSEDFFNGLDKINFIAIEDFGTSGLDGKTGEDGTHPDGRNNFYNFWWYEGKSKKTGKERGRWGLGKTTFHIASKLRLFWGLTVRHDDDRILLMGKTLLKTHKLNDKTYMYHGYYKEADKFKPYSDTALLEEFQRKFLLKRNNESGFSIVIPVPDEEITPAAILKALIIHYFYPILNGSLEAEIYNKEETIKLTASNLSNIAFDQDWTETEWEKVNVMDLICFIDKSINCEEKLVIDIKDLDKPQIVEDSFRGNIEEIRNAFNEGKLQSFQIPVSVTKKGDGVQETYFDIFIEKAPTLRIADEYYIRSGITISDIKQIKSIPIRGLLIAEDELVTEFLGDAETPAHTDWNERTEEFREKYEDAIRKLRFIKKALLSAVSLIYLPPKEQQRDFLKEIFYVPLEKDTGDKPENGESTGGTPADIPHLIPKFNIISLSDGIKVIPSKAKIEPPVEIEVKVAYDSRRGNPFKNYEVFDFDFSNSLLNINIKGCKIILKNRNIIRAEITEKDFYIEVRGFDSHRDLIANLKEIN